MEVIQDSKSVIHTLIDILWSDEGNEQVIHKTYQFIKQTGEIPAHLERCYEMMEEFQKRQHSIFHSFTILHPYERAWDFGSLALRKRIYAVAFTSEERFLEFEFPQPPKLRRKKLKDFLDRNDVKHEWKCLDKWMESFNSRSAWRDRSLELTFLTKEAEKAQCIPSRYTAQCASNSHVLSDDKKQWRVFSLNEIKRIMGIPEWFSFTENIQKIRKYEMLGQSVDGRVIKAIANRIAYCFMKVKNAAKKETEKLQQSYSVAGSGQLELMLS